MQSITPLFLIAVIVVSNIVSAQKTVTPQNLKSIADLSALNIQSNKVKSLDSLLQAFVDNKKLSCVAAFVAKGGTVVYKKAFGLKDIDYRSGK